MVLYVFYKLINPSDEKSDSEFRRPMFGNGAQKQRSHYSALA